MIIGILTIEYEAESADLSDPMSDDYFEINAVKVGDETLQLRPVDSIKLRSALEDVWNHSKR